MSKELLNENEEEKEEVVNTAEEENKEENVASLKTNARPFLTSFNSATNSEVEEEKPQEEVENTTSLKI